jgi:hypothetical protein
MFKPAKVNRRKGLARVSRSPVNCFVCGLSPVTYHRASSCAERLAPVSLLRQAHWMQLVHESLGLS